MVKNFSILFALIAAALIGFFVLSYHTKVSVVSDKPAETVEQSPVTFLVLGRMGKVVGWNQAPDLADSIVLVDYRPKIGVVNLISLPRDLYVNLGGERFKINEVVRRDKINELLAKLPDITGLSTDKYIVVDVDSLKNVVDGLAGIDINLDSDVIDKVSGFTMKAGQQHLNGDDVVWLVRNRFAPEGDFFREKNQHQVIEAIFSKYKNLNPLNKASFIFKIMPEITQLKTNLNFSEIIPAAENFGSVKFNDIVLDFNTGLVESNSIKMGTSTMYILLPKSGPEDYTDIKNYIESKLDQ